jgi:hypothetical protein
VAKTERQASETKAKLDEAIKQSSGSTTTGVEESALRLMVNLRSKTSSVGWVLTERQLIIQFSSVINGFIMTNSTSPSFSARAKHSI